MDKVIVYAMFENGHRSSRSIHTKTKVDKRLL